jgi:phosphoglycolate phosphatase
MRQPLLVLFDVDGTLLLDDAFAHGRAIVSALREVYKRSLPDDAVLRIEPWGKTDPRIAREVLRAAGAGDDEFDEHLTEWIEAATAAFKAEARTTRPVWIVRPDLVDALEQLVQEGMSLSLLTGNLRQIATLKLELMGVAAYFDLSAGAFGTDAEERSQLVPVARSRAGSFGTPWPRDRTAVVGDTPGDVATAQADRVRSILFSSRRFPEHRLYGAEAVVANVAGLVETLRDWHSARETVD